MINKKYLWSLILVYYGARFFSYWFSPETPLFSANPLNTIASLFILFLTCVWLVQGNEKGWLIIAGEIILGGGGNLFDIAGISLRTYLLVLSLTVFFVLNLKNKNLASIFSRNKTANYLIGALFLTAILSAGRAFLLGHSPRLIWADFSPYLFLGYFFPLQSLLTSEKFKNFIYHAFLAFALGNAGFILFTFFGFNQEIFLLQGTYYHWFRDVALGKITDLGGGFFRLVLNEHLWLVPLILFFTNELIKENKKIKYFTLAVLFVLAISITRIYILALIVGLLFLFNKQNWKKWLKISVLTGVIFLTLFSAINLFASGGKNSGLDLLGLRLHSVARPASEDSAFSRVLLLPNIFSKIKNNFIWGTGLGDTVTAYSPVFQKDITTPHFDWGYLEILAEMGLLGFLAWIAIIFYLLFLSWQKCSFNPLFLAITVGILIMNITSPILFHSLGILTVVGLLAILNKFDKIKDNLYDSTQRTIL